MSLAKNMRVHELAKELGMTNAEVLALCGVMGVEAKSQSSAIIEAQADRLRRRAERDGLTRPAQPEEAKTAKKAAAKKAAADTEAAPAKVPAKKAEPAIVADVTSGPVADETATPSAPPEPVVVIPAAPAPVETPVTPAVQAPPPQAPPAPSVAPAPPTRVVEVDEPRKIVSTRPSPGEPSRPSAVPARPLPSTAPRPPVAPAPAPVTPQRAPAPLAPAASVDAARPTAAPVRPAASAPARPASTSGRPIPPPPGMSRPVSASGRPIPPPPGSARPPAPGARSGPPGARPAGAGYQGRTTGPSGYAGRPAGPGGARPGGPGGYAGRPAGPGGARPGGPGGAGGPGSGPRPGGPGGGGPRPNGQRRAPRKKSRARRRRDFEEMQPQLGGNYVPSAAPVPEGTIVVERGASAQEFAPKLNRSAADVIRFLLSNGEMVTTTMTLTDEQMELFALEIGADLLLVEPGQQEELELQAMFDDSDDDDEEAQQLRAPIVTVMGHVDHGKTTLLDKIRKANVVAGEAGGITQHIGAYQVDRPTGKITFLDTPGHAAFTKMRARGAQVTDIVVLMVAADDGVMPQTIEAINHARAAEVPIIVAINKIDKDNADVQRTLSQLSEHELVAESWGGDTIVVEMSAQQDLGVDDLLEQLLVVAELEELTANPTGRAKGVVLEANLDTGRGPVATILIDKGTLKVGDPIVAGGAWGRVRAMIDSAGEQVKEAGPSTPVQVLGLSAVPNAGDEFRVAPDEKTARTVGEAREQRSRITNQRGDARVQRGVKLEDIFSQIQAGEVATLNLVLKADVQGSLEAVTESLRRLERDTVKLAFVHRAVGGITENDITLAAATNATLIGFNVRPDRKARDLAEAEHVEIRTYEIIYKLLEDIERAMVGLLAPEYEEVVTGEAEVREIFRVPKIGSIAGCQVRTGIITRGSKVRFLRDGVIIWKGSIQSLRRFKDDVREVREGFECGIGLSDFQDLKGGDLIETFEEREIARI
jgi:translation initiation factor IF-2